MGDIEWIVLSLGITFGNNLILWFLAFILSVVIFNIILEVFNENSK